MGRPVDVMGLARSIATVAIIAATLLATAAINRLPVLFPDTTAYNSAGEAVLGALGERDRDAPRHPAAAPVARAAPGAMPRGVSEARSPYYGLFLAVLDRAGGVWLTATVQALAAAVALVVALRRLGIAGPAGVATAAATIAGGLAFYAVVLLPDMFLGPVILALAFLPSEAAMARRERLFWAVLLVGGLLFHRSFLAVALVLVGGTGLFWRADWFSRRGWLLAAAATSIAAAGDAMVGPTVEHVYGAPVASPPFLLARMAEGRVVPAYLADVCATKPYLICRMRARLPIDHQRFLWAIGSDGAFNLLPLAERQRIGAEALPVITGAVAARPLAAASEALHYASAQLFFAGMDDFTQRVPTRWRIDPALQPAMAAYPHSGIIAGDFALHRLSLITRAVYFAGLAVLGGATVLVVRSAWCGRRALPTGRRTLAAVAIIVAGILVNAAVSGILSGLQDRYTGRIAWLAPLAAAAVIGELVATTRRSQPARQA